MKKIIICLMTICLGCSLTANAQSSILAKQKAKQAKKEYKQKVKEYTKGGWQILGSSKTLEMALLDHYEALEKDGVYELPGYATSTNKNIGKDKLAMSASSAYAQMIGSDLKGRITEDMSSNMSTEELSEFEHFYSAYENKVQAEIRGELKLSYTIYRPVKVNGKQAYEFEAHYLLDVESARDACLRAYEFEAKKSIIAQAHSEQISQHIKQAFQEE